MKKIKEREKGNHCYDSHVGHHCYNEQYYAPDFKLHITPSNMENLNTPEYLDKIKERLFENLRQINHAPSVPFHQTPRDDDDEDEDDNEADAMADVRISAKEEDKSVAHPADFYDGENDHDR